MDEFLIIAACSVLFVVVLLYLELRHVPREVREAVERMRRQQIARSELPVAECARACGERVPPEVARRVLRVLASLIESLLSPPGAGAVVDPGRLLPEDTLDEALAYHLDSLAYCEMAYRLEEEFGIGPPGRAWQEVYTVGDVIRLMAAEMEKKGSTALAPQGKGPGLVEHPMRDPVLDG